MVNIVFGPAAIETYAFSGAIGSFRLDDSDDSAGLILQIPTSGIITKVGFNITEKTSGGSTFDSGLYTLGSNGLPTTNAYGGSSPTSFSSTSINVGWNWVDLSSPATASRGDYVAIYIWPTLNNGPADYVRVTDSPVLDLGFPCGAFFTTAWGKEDGPNSFAFQYDNGTIVGYPIISGIGSYFNSSSSPDEIGCRFTLPNDLVCAGARFQIEDVYDNTSVDITLYDSGSSVLATTTIDDMASTNGIDFIDVLFDEDISLTADTTYRLAVKPTTVTEQIQLMIASFPSATERSCSIFESSRWYETYRTDGGSWTDNQLAIPWMGLLVSSIATSGGNGNNGTGSGSSEWGFVG